MSRYLFIDGGFVDALISRTATTYGIDLSSPPKYEIMRHGFARAFYYDALPTQKEDETEAAFNAKLDAKLRKFDLINRTQFMHVRAGTTRSRSPKKALQQKGVDILLAIDVFKHAARNNISEAHIMATDLDFFPLFEAIRDTPVSTYLHCFTEETSEELMSLADVVKPTTPVTVLKWYQLDPQKFIKSHAGAQPATIFKQGTCNGGPFYIYKDPPFDDERPFFARSMSVNPDTLWVADKWQFLVWDFEERFNLSVHFERS